MQKLRENPREVTFDTKDLTYYMSLPYSIFLIPPDEKDSRWFARIPELDSCSTYAESREEVLEMIEDAKYTWLEVSLEHGDPIPEPHRG